VKKLLRLFIEQKENTNFLREKRQILNDLSYKSTFMLGFRAGVVGVLIPSLVILLIIFTPTLISRIISIAQGLPLVEGSPEAEVLTVLLPAWLKTIFLLTIIYSTVCGMNACLRKYSFTNSERGKIAALLYYKAVLFWSVSSLSILIIWFNAEISKWGLIFLVLVLGWLFRIALHSWYLMMEDRIVKKYLKSRTT